ncbi:MAG TPA: hypothetical protein VIV66_15675, partial [Pyrinomonadaceae bacterium]
MRIEVKYGLLIALGAIGWVVITHVLVRDPRSMLHSLGAVIVFNVLQFAGIYLGISAKRREGGRRLTFKESLKTGVAISFVYAVAISSFFVGALFIVGSKMLAAEGSPTEPIAQTAAKAFAGMFFLTLVFGLIYSTIISFAIA